MHKTHNDKQRKCSTCGENKPSEDFPFVSKKINSERKRYPASCASCWRKYKAQWAKDKRKNNPQWRERVNKQKWSVQFSILKQVIFNNLIIIKWQ
jgi:hypothetical protein